ncbi:MAG TPA: V-type ATPase subunit subunit G family protein [bacterium]|nr:V-type ATPase subunit subunit G family protein [bacterium]
MTPHEPPDRSSDEALLREIASREQELQRQVAEARAEAARRIEQAQRQAEDLRGAARKRAADLAAGASADTSREADRLGKEILARAEAEAAAIRKRADEYRAEAVQLVVREVLGGPA